MKTMKFKCTLLTDVILNVKSASEGNNQTLDFIPGNNFLGMVASKLYTKDLPANEALDLFHNGTVRYGDAHVAVGNRRSLKVPAVMYQPKEEKTGEMAGEKTDKEVYIYYAYNREKDGDKKQLKQCRSGFYVFNDNQGIAAKVEKTFAIKSAYDRDKRRAKDEQMFGYESLRAGLVFYFTVETDNDDYEEKITNALLGTKHLGRSRTAQYGLVKIEEADFVEEQSKCDTNGDEMITVYADGRLIFLDKCGEPTFQPTPKQLGLNEEAKINWKKSQIRTFQYAPWNFKRQAYDTDRCGIEKGSVFVVEGGNFSTTDGKSVGNYLNEGFGKVIYNPHFLKLDSKAENGEAKCKLTKPQYEEDSDTAAKERSCDSDLLTFLKNKKTKNELLSSVYKLVNEFVSDNEDRFKGDSFASQWGTIRSIAMSEQTKQGIKNALFADETGYLCHGKAEVKWSKEKRKENFENFCNVKLKSYDDDFFKMALINLAAEMAKIAKK